MSGLYSEEDLSLNSRDETQVSPVRLLVILKTVEQGIDDKNVQELVGEMRAILKALDESRMYEENVPITASTAYTRCCDKLMGLILEAY